MWAVLVELNVKERRNRRAVEASAMTTVQIRNVTDSDARQQRSSNYALDFEAIYRNLEISYCL